jgi:hypothetical protein
MIKEENAANVTGPAVVGTGDDISHWKNTKKKKLRDILPLVRRSELDSTKGKKANGT